MPGKAYHSHHHNNYHHSHHSHQSSRRGIRDPPGHQRTCKDPPGRHAEASTKMKVMKTIQDTTTAVVASPPASIRVVTGKANTDGRMLDKDMDVPHDERHFDCPASTRSTAYYSPAQAKADMERMMSIVSRSSTSSTSPDDTSASASVTTDEEGSSSGSGSTNNPGASAWVAFSDGHDDGKGENKHNGHGPPRHSSSTTFGVPSNNTSSPNANGKSNGKSPPAMPTTKSSFTRTNSDDTNNLQGDEEDGLGTTTNTAFPNADNESDRKRRFLLIALAAVLLVAIIGIACGVALGGNGSGNDNTTSDVSKAPNNNNKAGSYSSGASGGTGTGSGMESDEQEGPSWQEELFSSMQDGYNGQQQSNSDLPPNQQDSTQDADESNNNASPTDDGGSNIGKDTQQQPSSCADDPTWLVVVGDRHGKSVFTPYGCEWVATDPRENCNTVGATPSVSSINRIGEVATAGWIACPKACGSCSDGGGGQNGQIVQDADPADVSVTVGTVSEPTPAPTKRPTNKPTRAPVQWVPVPVPRPILPPTLGKVDSSDAENAITCQSTAIDTNADEIALPFLPGVAVGSVDATILGEASGLVASTGGLNPGILWTHNDAPKFPNRPNNRNRIYAIDAHSHGDVIATYSLEGAKNIDWEDIAYGTGPEAGVKYIYLGDIGDNDEIRREIYIYRVKEPDISAGGSPFLTEWDRLTLTYPDRRPRNVEAFLFDPVDEIFYLMTKTGGFIFSTRAKWGQGSTSMTLRQAGQMSEFRKQPLVGADISPDGKEILLKYYGSVKYFCRDSEVESVADVFQTHDSLKLSYDRENEPKGEAVAWTKEGFYTLSEQDRQATTPLYFYKRSEH